MKGAATSCAASFVAPSAMATSWGRNEPFFHLLVEDLAKAMGQAYPELVEAKTRVAAVLKQEEERFAETLENGMEVLEAALRRLEGRMLDGETFSGCTIPSAFRWISPPILRASAASQWIRPVLSGRWSASASAPGQQASSRWRKALRTAGRRRHFTAMKACGTKGRCSPSIREGSRVDFIEAGDEAVVVLDQTPFYAESGGQVGDRGELLAANGTFAVSDTQKIQADVFGHKGLLRSGRLVTGDTVVGGGRSRGAGTHRAQPFCYPPDAQGAAPGIGRLMSSKKDHWSIPTRRALISRITSL